MRNIWNSWKNLIKKITNIQVNVILTIIFAVIIVPLAFVMQILNKFSEAKKANNNEISFWQVKQSQKDIRRWAKKL